MPLSEDADWGRGAGCVALGLVWVAAEMEARFVEQERIATISVVLDDKLVWFESCCALRSSCAVGTQSHGPPCILCVNRVEP